VRLGPSYPMSAPSYQIQPRLEYALSTEASRRLYFAIHEEALGKISLVLDAALERLCD
jgi:hypothetical protein